MEFPQGVEAVDQYIDKACFGKRYFQAPYLLNISFSNVTLYIKIRSLKAAFGKGPLKRPVGPVQGVLPFRDRFAIVQREICDISLFRPMWVIGTKYSDKLAGFRRWAGFPAGGQHVWPGAGRVR